ncbi:Mut7-C RNAse domain-containing protein [Naasia sp. SYSU D00948]|uniref:Mut7-C RNAse domain-containing protein n=1 Tax=Naasia sp. SYSU D00948 TaxID=2817379 RepID=UPI001B311BA6|nr:Mut7-C RNAse domain-containing protein [Naasia sp. SYSU D00948]
MWVVAEVDRALRFLMHRRRRGLRVELDVGETDTAGHVVQVLGIPLTEVGRMTVDGVPVERKVRRNTPLSPGSLIRIGPRDRPQPHTGRFLLDVHLGSLTRRLRLLGIDAAYDPQADDDVLAVRSAAEDRVLLTRDRGLLFRAVIPDGAFVRFDGTDDQEDDFLERFGPTLAPWTRCLVCGDVLTPAATEEVAGDVEPGTQRTYQQFSRCSGCGRVYWRGAHSRRLEAIVERARARLETLRGPAG